MRIVALSPKLESFRLVDPLNRVRADGGFAFAILWESEIAPAQRDDVFAYVPGSHAVGPEEIRVLKARYRRLALLSAPMTGIDGIDGPGQPTCRSLGIDVVRVEAYCTDEVVEHAATLALAVRHRVVQTNLQMQRKEWKRVPTVEISAATIGVIGLGRIGMASARRWRRDGHRVVGWNRSAKPEFVTLGGEQLPLAQVMEQADVILVHLPLVTGAGGTKNLIDQSMIDRMRSDALLVNVARAGIVDRVALAQAIRTRRIFGAGIDVFEDEPPFDSGKQCDAILDLDPHEFNVVLTDHGAFNKRGPLQVLARNVLENVKAWCPGRD